MQQGFYFDQTRCTGCFACAVACKDWHDIPAGPVKWRTVSSLERGVFPTPFLAYLSASCYHCETPPCRDVCPVGAIAKRKQDGIVVVDPELCLGSSCGLCKGACPYDAPQFVDGGNAKMQKCDFCLERSEAGGKPVCVESCPLRALDSGPMEELRERYGQEQHAAGFEYAAGARPAVIFKPKN